MQRSSGGAHGQNPTNPQPQYGHEEEREHVDQEEETDGLLNTCEEEHEHLDQGDEAEVEEDEVVAKEEEFPEDEAEEQHHAMWHEAAEEEGEEPKRQGVHRKRRNQRSRSHYINAVRKLRSPARY